MNISITRTTGFMLTMALLVSHNAMALKVYQWTDAEGVVHYSDTPPPDDNASSAINETELVNFSGDEAKSDKYSIVNQLEQMIAWRRQTEEDQRAWKQLELEEERLALEQQSLQPAADISTDTYNLPVYYPRTYYPHVYPSHYPAYVPRYTKGHDHPVPNKHFTKGYGLGKKGHHGLTTMGSYQFK